MKKLFIFIPILFISTLLISSTIFADVIPPGMHRLNPCVKVVNLDKFPDVVLIGYITRFVTHDFEAYQIKNNECLTRGYYVNSLDIYWTPKEKFNQIDLKKLSLDMTLLLKDVENIKNLDDSNPLIKETIEYSLAKLTDGKLVLYKSKQTSTYNNGTPKKVVTFNAPKRSVKIIDQPIEPAPTPIQKPEEQGFWHSITCFFKKLFGTSCS